MGLLKLLFAVVFVGIAAAFVTKPDRADAETALKEELYDRLFSSEVEIGNDMLGNAVIFGCQVKPEVCYDLLRRGLDVQFDDMILFSRVEVEGFGHGATCFGAFTRFVCPGGFREV